MDSVTLNDLKNTETCESCSYPAPILHTTEIRTSKLPRKVRLCDVCYRSFLGLGIDGVMRPDATLMRGIAWGINYLADLTSGRVRREEEKSNGETQ